MNIKEVLKQPEYDFIDTAPRLGNNIMLLTFGGSHSYGTNGPQSDIDIRGIVAPTKADILGVNFIKQPEDVNNSNLIFGNTGFEQYNDAATDTVIYGLDKILKLLYKCNPNTVEILGCLPEHYAKISPAGQLLIDNRRLFLSKLAYDSFSGYARQQLYRLKNALARDSMSLAEKQFYMIDVVNRMYNHLEMSYPTFKREYIRFYVTDRAGNEIVIKNEVVTLEKLVFTYKDKVLVKGEVERQEIDLNDTELRVDINIKKMSPQDISGVYNEISAVLKDFSTHIGHRNQKKDEYHLNKHAMHLVRLYKTGFDIFKKYDIITHRGADLDELLAIKNGYYMQPDGNYKPEFYRNVDEYEKELKRLAESSKLPDKPDEQAIQKLVMQIKEAIIFA